MNTNPGLAIEVSSRLGQRIAQLRESPICLTCVRGCQTRKPGSSRLRHVFRDSLLRLHPWDSYGQCWKI